MFNNEARVFMTLKDSKYIFDDKIYYYGEIYPTKPEYAELDSTYFKELVDEKMEMEVSLSSKSCSIRVRSLSSSKVRSPLVLPLSTSLGVPNSLVITVSRF